MDATVKKAAWNFHRPPSFPKANLNIYSSLSKGRDRVHGHEKASKKPTSLQAMSPALEKQYTAPPPDLTRDKL